jgi:8-oxo-dGTP pyrophosphatase MutT (NUDIX family)
VIQVEQVRCALSSHRAVVLPTQGIRHAAVAMILTEGKSGADVLFIERARFSGDPWSGHMAFPGGGVEPDDPSGRAAAERETLEEVGLSLAGAELLGQLDDKRGNPRTNPELVISAFVYHTRAPGDLAINHEVQDAFWFPLGGLLDRARHVQYTAHGEFEFPGILVGSPIATSSGGSPTASSSRSSTCSDRRCPTGGPRRCARTRARWSRRSVSRSSRRGAPARRP